MTCSFLRFISTVKFEPCQDSPQSFNLLNKHQQENKPSSLFSSLRSKMIDPWKRAWKICWGIWLWFIKTNSQTEKIQRCHSFLQNSKTDTQSVHQTTLCSHWRPTKSSYWSEILHFISLYFSGCLTVFLSLFHPKTSCFCS